MNKKVLNVLQKLAERSTKTSRQYALNIFKGLTVQEFISKLELETTDNIKIRVDKNLYDEDVDGYKLIKKIRFKQVIEQKQFKEKIIVHLQNPADIVKYNKKNNYDIYTGYIIKLFINITTEETL